MRAEALATAGGIGPTTSPVLSDIAPAAPLASGLERRELVVATVPRTEAAGVLRRVKDAGITIDAVLTPAAALTSLARLRRGCASLDALEGPEGYIALEESASTIAVVRDGHLVAERTVPWGYLSESSAHTVVRAREEIVQRLAAELSMCMASWQLNTRPLEHICVCGALPELRSMAVSLTERLDIEVETLDGLFGIDARRLPEPAAEFRERTAELRIAWAAAADREPILDLLRERKRQARKAAFSKVAIIAGVTVGLAGGWALQRQWRPVESVTDRTAPAGSVAEYRSTPNRSAPARVAVPRSAPEKVTAAAPRQAPTSTPQPGAPRTAAAAPEQPATRPPASAPAPAPQSLPPPSRRSLEPIVPQPAAPEPTPRVEPPPLPFDATLGTILYGPERKLAIIDGRIVQAGDDVRGARIIEITPTSVYLRDEQGRLRRLTAGGSSR